MVKKSRTLKAYKLGFNGRTIPLGESYSSDSCFGFLLPYYFQVFKAWAIVSHKSLNEYYKAQMPSLYKKTFISYCNGGYRVCSINRLFLYFTYFRYNEDIYIKMMSEGIDLSNVDFWQFLQLRDIPLPDNKLLNVPIIWNDLIPRKYVQLPDNQGDTIHTESTPEK